MHIMYHLILWSTSVRLHIRDTYANRHTHIYWLWSGGCPLIMWSQWGDREQRNTLNRKQVSSPGLVRQLHLWQWLRVFARMHVAGKWTTMRDSLWFIGTYQVSSILNLHALEIIQVRRRLEKSPFGYFFSTKTFPCHNSLRINTHVGRKFVTPKKRHCITRYW